MSEGKKELVWLITGAFKHAHPHRQHPNALQIHVPGTSSGFGHHLVLIALSRGDCVIATARSLDKIQDFPASDKLRTMPLDVTEGFASIKAKIDEAVTFFGRIDVLVNNAGYGHKAILEEGGCVHMSTFVEGTVMFGSSVLTEPGRSDVLRQQFDTNFFGLVDVTNAVLPHMRDRFSGTIVLIGSRASWVPEIPVGILTIRSNTCRAYRFPMKHRVPVSRLE